MIAVLMIVSRAKFLTVVSAITLTSYFVVTDAQAAATVCNNGAAATIDVGACTVAAGTIPTTIVFQSEAFDVGGVLGTLTLNAAAPTGAVTNTVAGEGAVVVSGSTSSVSTFGVGGGGALASLTVNDAITFSLGHALTATTVTVGSGAGTGVINQSAGT